MNLPVEVHFRTPGKKKVSQETPNFKQERHTRCYGVTGVQTCALPIYLLILKSLVAGELHGLGISRRVQQITSGTFLVKPGSLFPALHRMEEEGWISSFWGDSENNRRAKYYRLTKPGRKQLEVETKRWGRISWAIGQALETT